LKFQAEIFRQTKRSKTIGHSDQTLAQELADMSFAPLVSSETLKQSSSLQNLGNLLEISGCSVQADKMNNAISHFTS